MTVWSDTEASFVSHTLSGTDFGTVIDVGYVADTFAAAFTVTYNNGDGWNVNIQGSLDNANWYDLDPYPSAWIGTASSSGTTTSLKIWSMQPSRYVRARGILNAGSPVVDVVVMSKR